jgi:hypothetical protein
VRSWAQQQDLEVDTNEVREKYTVTGISLVRQRKKHDLSLTIFRMRKLRREIFYYFYTRRMGVFHKRQWSGRGAAQTF